MGSDSESAKKKIISLFKTVDDLAQNTDITKLDEFSMIYKNRSQTFHETPFEERVLSVSLESAELIKVSANAFLTTKISFANSIARICDAVGADVTEVMDGVGMDHRIGRAFLYAGLGWGGGCFPKDTAGLIYSAEEVGVSFALLKSVVDVNNSQILYVTRKAIDMLNDKIEGKTVTVLGLTFKPGTSDIRISPSIKLIKSLLQNEAKLRVYDPQGMEEAQREIDNGVYFAESIEDALHNTHLAILATEWPEFQNIDFKKVQPLFKSPNLLDARNKWPKEELIKLGYRYQGIGR